MARSRNIKPGLFKNEILGVADPLYTLAFQGLWLLADREGRLEDRPLRIKAETFPYRDGLDIDSILNWLEAEGFVLRYEVSGRRYIQVLNFAKHQNPHKNETASDIPAPDQSDCVPKKSVLVPSESEALVLIPDSLNLIPDSLNLIPDSSDSDAGASVVAGKTVDACPHKEIIALYQKHLPMLPVPKVWEGKRAEALRARWRWVLTAKKANGQRYATDRESGLDFFERFFEYAAQSDFLTGRDGKWRGCDIGWLVKAENFVKVLEGKYLDDREAA